MWRGRRGRERGLRAGMTVKVKHCPTVARVPDYVYLITNEIG